MTTRRRVLIGLAGASAALWSAGLGACSRSASPAERAISRAAAWIEGRQRPDGGFGSHLALGQGAAPFALLSLMAAGSAKPRIFNPAIDRLLKLRRADGAWGYAGERPDRPILATALFQRVLMELRPELAAPGEVWMLEQQLRGPSFVGKPGFGGWSAGGQERAADLAVTRRVLQCYLGRIAGQLDALDFVRRCKRPEGGFVLRPGGGGDHGIASTEGILALRALSQQVDAPEVVEALAFLRSIHRPDRDPGAAKPLASRFRYLAGSARVFWELGGPEDWRAGLIEVLLREQRPDGSFVGEAGEADPLLATGCALQSLAFAVARV